jgi:hypothetical protein
VKHVAEVLCKKCNGTGIDYNHEEIIITEDVLCDLLHFQHISHYGEKWLAFVDWSQLHGFDLPRLIDGGWIDKHPDKPPMFNNYRDNFPERLYSISFKGRLVIQRPSMYLCDT